MASPAKKKIDEVNYVDSEAEERLARNVVAFAARAPHLCLSAESKRIYLDVSTSFAEACKDPCWGVAIAREINALLRRGTCIYVPRTQNIRPVS